MLLRVGGSSISPSLDAPHPPALLHPTQQQHQRNFHRVIACTCNTGRLHGGWLTSTWCATMPVPVTLPLLTLLSCSLPCPLGVVLNATVPISTINTALLRTRLFYHPSSIHIQLLPTSPTLASWVCFMFPAVGLSCPPCSAGLGGVHAAGWCAACGQHAVRL